MKKINYLIVMVLLIMGCDESIISYNPESGSLSGTVTFSNINRWPSTGSIAISLSSNWPPKGAPAAFTSISISDLSVDKYNYTFDNLSFKTYKAIAVSWADPNDPDPETNQHILGAYGGTINTEFSDADSITISVLDPIKNELNFISDLSLIIETEETEEIETGTISGEITFSGDWPTNTVWVTLSSFWPLTSTPNYYLEIKPTDLVSNKYNYIFKDIVLGTYKAIAVFEQTPSWIPRGAYGSISTSGPDYQDAVSVTIDINNTELINMDFSVFFSN